MSFNNSLAYSSPEKFDDNQNDSNLKYMSDWSVHLTDQKNEYERNIPVFNNEEPRYNTCVESSADSTSGSMDFAWPTLSHDAQHTGHSPYPTTANPGTELWRIRGNYPGEVWSSPVIDQNNIIYFNTIGGDSALYAIYQNDSIKWRYQSDGLIWCTPAIAEDGTLYFTTWGAYGYVHAVYPNGTRRWLYHDGYDSSSLSPPTIGNDGTIYFGSEEYKIYAVNPDGTEKWRYLTGYIIMSSPAIGTDSTIYIGSGDHYLYALFPNGTLHWRFPTGSEIKGSASIAPDGTIYVPSFDGYLYALHPNGTMKWRASTGSSIAAAGTALAEDGTIYVGTEQLRAFYPNGTLKWTTNVQGSIYGTVPAISADGTIYVSAGGSLVAVNPDGIERWRKQLTIAQIHSSPSIGPDDRMYVGSETYETLPYGYLHAFGLGPLRAEAGGPYQGTALRPTTLTGLAFGGIPPYTYRWDFGDGNTSTDLNPTHIYTTAGNYTATFTITDNEGNTSNDTTTVTMDYPFPTLTITRPTNAIYIADKQLFPFPFPFILGKITIQVTVEDHYSINQVIFCIHGEAVYTDTTPPYEWTWIQRNFRLKDNIYVIAWDAKGRYAEQRMDVIKWF
ncbi:MAG: PQQ-binding-like beta-propeller repeat protein [Thermoplasmata archaeon]|nr:PQQ-binding-like beta-propeller repeat protein [Thermoplasmata archaeon]